MQTFGVDENVEPGGRTRIWKEIVLAHELAGRLNVLVYEGIPARFGPVLSPARDDGQSKAEPQPVSSQSEIAGQLAGLNSSLRQAMSALADALERSEVAQ